MSLTLWQPKSEEEQPLPIEWVKKLFQKLTARYGTQFTEKFGGVPPDVMAQEWAEELAGFTGPELSRGLAALRGRTFPPSLPEFQALCRPPIDAESAFHEAIRNLRARERGDNPQWSHPAIYWAAVSVGGHDMRSIPYKDLKNRWEKALSKQFEAGSWEPIPKALVALPEPPRKPNPEVMAKLRALTERMKQGHRNTNHESSTDEHAPIDPDAAGSV